MNLSNFIKFYQFRTRKANRHVFHVINIRDEENLVGEK